MKVALNILPKGQNVDLYSSIGLRLDPQLPGSHEFKEHSSFNFTPSIFQVWAMQAAFSEEDPWASYP